MTAAPRKSTARKAAPRKTAEKGEPSKVGSFLSAAPEESVSKPAAGRPGRFAALRREALADYEPMEPYVIGEADGVVPDIVITEPVESERVIAMLIAFDSGDKMRSSDLQPLMRGICGDAWDRIWNELLRGEHLSIMQGLMFDLVDYFSDSEAFKKGMSGAGETPGE